jgi:serine/threonine protein kinase
MPGALFEDGPVTEARIRAGDRLGGYQVLEQLPGAADPDRAPSPEGVSGLYRPLGTAVYKAQDPRNQELVAIRVYPAQFARDPELLKSLRDGLREVARLDHPNITAPRGSGMHGGQPFVVFPYLAAGCLQDRIASGLVSALDLSELTKQITAALSLAHEQGLVHGDLKPSKVLFAESGAAQIAGLGEAQALHRAASPGGRISGPTNGYQAPELAKLGIFTARADQYSLAVILLELFTGHPPQEALPVLHAGKHPGAAHPGARPENLPVALWEVLRRATAADPRRRFDTLEEMHHALRIALGLEQAPQQSSDDPVLPIADNRQQRRGRLRLVWIAALLTGLCAVVTVPAFSARGAWQLRDLPELLWGASTTTQPVVDRQDSLPGVEQTTAAPPARLDGGSPAPDSGPQEPAASSLASTPTSEPGDSSQAGPAPPTAGGPTSTPQPTSTAVLIPSSTVIPTATPDTLAFTDTPVPAPTAEPTEPGPEPTKKPGKCKDDPSHPNYCTPTP